MSQELVGRLDEVLADLDKVLALQDKATETQQAAFESNAQGAERHRLIMLADDAEAASSDASWHFVNTHGAEIRQALAGKGAEVAGDGVKTLQRWTPIPNDDDSSFLYMTHHAHGQWLRYDDVAAPRPSPDAAGSQWVSVSERLPEMIGYYWAALEHGMVRNLYWSGKYWTGGITRDCKKPTHWQPIAAPAAPAPRSDV